MKKAPQNAREAGMFVLACAIVFFVVLALINTGVKVYGRQACLDHPASLSCSDLHGLKR